VAAQPRSFYYRFISFSASIAHLTKGGEKREKGKKGSEAAGGRGPCPALSVEIPSHKPHKEKKETVASVAVPSEANPSTSLYLPPPPPAITRGEEEKKGGKEKEKKEEGEE